METLDIRVREFEAGKWYFGNALHWEGPFESELKALQAIKPHYSGDGQFQDEQLN